MTIKTNAKEHLIIALDTSREDEALKLIEKLSSKVGYFKVGLELFTGLGPKIIERIKEHGNKVFFDGKFLDIPNTVSKAVSNMVKHRVDMLNVYMSGGKKMLEAAKNSLIQTANENDLQTPKLLGVTVLTSITNDVLQNDLKVKAQIDEYVLHLAQFALQINLDGIICSPNEAKIIRELSKNNKNFLIVTPGVRPLWAESNDQERIATPKDAINNGATHIVIGRPVTGARDPAEATEKVLDEIESALKDKC
ncbi:MAG: orotidine-5'-phosphate decarboxylase [Candidatus Melainabacteria bacterium]|nr:orotidine-5'-phosphate decarboxylase [Candidatus Melainabacteria bacterium]